MGNEICQLPVPYVVVVPICILTKTNTVLPICLYLPTIVPLPIDGLDPDAVHAGVYVVQARLSAAAGPVGTVGGAALVRRRLSRVARHQGVHALPRRTAARHARRVPGRPPC